MNRIPDIQSALQSDDEEIRRKAIQGVHGLPLQNSRDLLFCAMGDESWRIRKEAVELFIAASPDESMIADLLELLRSEDNAGLRNSAAEAVIRLGKKSIQPLIQLVRDPDADVRKFVIDVMGTISDHVFIPSLLASLQDDDVNVSSAAAEHLGTIGNPEVVPDLLHATVSNQSELFRFSALASIGKLASPAPVPEEIRQLAGNELLRKAVYDCLGSIADGSALSVLMEGLALRQRSSRNAALLATYRLYSRSTGDDRQAIESSLRLLRGGDVIPLLIESFDARDTTLSEALVTVLDIVGDRRCVEVFLPAYAHERLSRVALKALKNLGTDGMDFLLYRYGAFDEEARAAVCSLVGDCLYLSGKSIILEALDDTCPRVQRAAVAAAGKLGLTECIPSVVRLLDSIDQDVRDSVVICLQALALIDRSGIQIVAGQIAESPYPELRRNAAVLFAALGDNDHLALLAKDEDSHVREAAVVSIGKLRFAPACGTLQIALVDENPDVRIAAAEALGSVGGDSAATSLKQALSDDDLWVQCAALKSLAVVSPEMALGCVSDLFGLTDGLLMITCLEVLDQVGGRGAMALVEKALENSDSEIVSRALDIISRHAEDLLAEAAPGLLKHPNWNIRMSCARAVAKLPPEKSVPLISSALEIEENDLVRTQLENLLKGLA